MCIKAQYSALLREIKIEDLFAGLRAKDCITYVGTIGWVPFPIELNVPI